MNVETKGIECDKNTFIKRIGIEMSSISILLATPYVHDDC